MPDRKFFPVESNKNLVRDSMSGAILNINVDGQAKYRRERDQRLKVAKMAEEFESLKSDVADIKNLLQKLLDK